MFIIMQLKESKKNNTDQEYDGQGWIRTKNPSFIYFSLTLFRNIYLTSK